MAGFLTVLLGVGLVTGLTTVLFGFGGGFVTVPAVTVAVGAVHGGLAMHIAVATSTAVMIVNALWATLVSARSGQLRRRYLWPFAGFIAVGAALGAVAANLTSETVLHWLFAAYIAATIIDSVARRGFFADSAADTEAAALTSAETVVGGVGVGAIAAFLGVGGSIVTVPLLRRKGVAMAEAAATANPLSLPAAIVASIAYAVSTPSVALPYSVGYVNVAAVGVLLLGSLPTIVIVRRALSHHPIPDRIHAVLYIALLAIVLVVMLVITPR